MLDVKVSNFIEQQFPQIYREEGPFFVEFVKQYYKWLETDPTSPVYQTRNYLKNHDVDTTVDDFVVYFKEKYLKNIQLNTATNTKQLVKNSIDLYRSKGSENAINLFFDLIFSVPSEVYYPGNDVFKLSDAEWVIPRYIEVTSNAVNRLMVGRAIVGVESGATAFVEKLVRRRIKNHYIEIFYISAITGEFETGEIISLVEKGNTPIEQFPTMVGSLNEVTVVDGSTEFSVGDVVKLESPTGAQGKAIVQKLETLTGLVTFKLEDGGWGYTSDADIFTSNAVLQLSNVQIVDTANASLYEKIINIVQPTANVQWYANTTLFQVGDVVYNYYANGSLIGSNRIISAEYGTSNTTNYFMLTNISGQNAWDNTAPQYFTAGNTNSFTVQNAGWTDTSANGVFNGMSSNVFINCIGDSSPFRVGDNVYQISTNNQVYAAARVQSVSNTGSNSFTLKVNGLDGLYLTNQTLRVEGSNVNVGIDSLSYDIGLRDVQGTFRSFPGNLVKDTGNTSMFSATAFNVPFGSGASIGMDDDVTNPEVVELNLNFLIDHANNALARNQLNATSYGAELNTANATNMSLANALSFSAKTIGTISRLQLANPGHDYSFAPFVRAIDPLMSSLYKQDFVLRLSGATGVFANGELVTQSLNGARGLVKSANTTEVHVRRLTYSDRWEAGTTNNHLIVGQFSGHSALVNEVTYDAEGIAGRNAEISTKVTSSNSAVVSLKVTDSGFAFLDGQPVTFMSEDYLRSGTATASVKTSGSGSGFYRTSAGFLSADKYLYDGDYYQDFSYEIRSPITISRYSDMLKNVLHVSGTKAFSSISKTSFVARDTDLVKFSGTVVGSLNGEVTVDANTVSFTLTGQSITPQIGRGLRASNTVFSFTGKSAALGYSKNISSAVGTFTISNTDALFKVGMPVSSGVLTLTGPDRTLATGRKLAANGTTLGLTGFATGSTVPARILTANAIAYTLTGGSIGLGKNYTMGTTKVTYNYAGSDVYLGYSGDESLSIIITQV